MLTQKRREQQKQWEVQEKKLKAMKDRGKSTKQAVSSPGNFAVLCLDYQRQCVLMRYIIVLVCRRSSRRWSSLASKAKRRKHTRKTRNN
jgi:hypothetical protein